MTTEAVKAVENAKKVLTEAPILIFADKDRENDTLYGCKRISYGWGHRTQNQSQILPNSVWQ